MERLNRARSNGSVKFAATSFLRGLDLSNTVADAALKLDESAMLNGTDLEEAKTLDTGCYLEHKERLREVTRL